MQAMAVGQEEACLGEWRGRGKVIKITRDGDELLVDMGPGVPTLALVTTASKKPTWPLERAVVRRPEAGRASGSQATVYLFELPDADAKRLLVKKPSGDGAVEFERVEHGAVQAQDDPPTAVAERAKSRSRSRRRRSKTSFADSLVKIASDKKEVRADRERLAKQWLAYETKLLDQAVELFKQRCIREAENQRCKATINFEVLSREIEDFPQRVLSGSTYSVGSWGEGSAEAWFYATRGVATKFSEGTEVLFAELLQALLPKFVTRLKTMGFHSCSHEAGTWRVLTSWKRPEPEEDAAQEEGDEE